jgi:hypothetical protein
LLAAFHDAFDIAIRGFAMTSTPADEPPKGQPPQERQSVRERTFLPARIKFGDGVLSTQCTVTQLSAVGARLNISASVSMPDRFDIEIPQRGVSNRARLVWRKDDQAGIEFDGRGQTGATEVGDLQGRIRELEATNVKLRAQISDLLVQVKRLTED